MGKKGWEEDSCMLEYTLPCARLLRIPTLSMKTSHLYPFTFEVPVTYVSVYELKISFLI